MRFCYFKPPVCKIVDYGKFNYERQKRKKAGEETSACNAYKGTRFNPNTDTHDIDFGRQSISGQFLIEGHKVKAYVMFKGRMITHPEIGRKLMEYIVEKLNDIGKLEAPPKMEGNQLYAYFYRINIKIQVYKTILSKHKKPSETKPERGK